MRRRPVLFGKRELSTAALPKVGFNVSGSRFRFQGEMSAYMVEELIGIYPYGQRDEV